MTPAASHGPGIGGPVLVTAVLAVAGAVVAGATTGEEAAWGVVVGAVVTVVVFSVGMGITHAAAALSPALSLLVALMTYVLQLGLLVLVLVWLERSSLLGGTLDRRWIGATIIVGTLVWSAALVRADLRRSRPGGQYHSAWGAGEPGDEPSPAPDPGRTPPR